MKIAFLLQEALYSHFNKYYIAYFPSNMESAESQKTKNRELMYSTGKKQVNEEEFFNGINAINEIVKKKYQSKRRTVIKPTMADLFLDSVINLHLPLPSELHCNSYIVYLWFYHTIPIVVHSYQFTDDFFRFVFDFGENVFACVVSLYPREIRLTNCSINVTDRIDLQNIVLTPAIGNPQTLQFGEEARRRNRRLIANLNSVFYIPMIQQFDIEAPVA